MKTGSESASIVVDSLSILQRLVAFRPISSSSNLPLIDFCVQRLREAGIVAHTVSSPCGRKAALYATIGPDAPGGVVLSGHTDVVPTDGQTWMSDPWAVVERSGTLYCRGTSDMLGFVSLCLAAAPAYASRPLRRPLHLAFSYDEETDCAGGKQLVERLKAKLATPTLVIVGEPTNQSVVLGHKSYTELRITAKGVAVHSSRPDLGASALTAAARAVAYIGDLQSALASDKERQDSRFSPPFSTLNCGIFHSGTAPSTVAAEAVFSIDIRTVPSVSPDDLIGKIRSFAASLCERPTFEGGSTCDFSVDVVTAIPGLTPSLTSNARTFVERLNLLVSEKTISGGTEAGLFQAAGWPTIVCGPGDLQRAHVADEFITIQELEAYAVLLEGIADELCTE
ncbi:acetylornithine deacetylase [Shinella sumterensis]|uniref:acetylornithine deacetylase n=1 Tax=Shinella sumterensis TaxID=1967501 RepID=UPI003F824652